MRTQPARFLLSLALTVAATAASAAGTLPAPLLKYKGGGRAVSVEGSSCGHTGDAQWTKRCTGSLLLDVIWKRASL
jgi:hypothetical protein